MIIWPESFFEPWHSRLVRLSWATLVHSRSVWSLGNYANGFVLKNEKLDFDRDTYLEQYLGSYLYTFMSAVANTQMFEQVRSSPFPG